MNGATGGHVTNTRLALAYEYAVRTYGEVLGERITPREIIIEYHLGRLQLTHAANVVAHCPVDLSEWYAERGSLRGLLPGLGPSVEHDLELLLRSGVRALKDELRWADPLEHGRDGRAMDLLAARSLPPGCGRNTPAWDVEFPERSSGNAARMVENAWR